MQPTDIDYINAHGTSTPLGDIAETHRGQARVRRPRVASSRCSSTKSMTGHLLGAAGGIEAVFTVLAMRDQIAPPTINLVKQDPAVRPRLRAEHRAPDEDRRRAVELVRLRRHQRDARVPHAAARRLGTSHHGTHRPEIRRHLGRQHRAHQERRAPRRALRTRRATSSWSCVSAMSGETNRLLALAKELIRRSRPARARRDRLHRRAGHDRPARDRAAGARAQGAQLHRRAGARSSPTARYTKARILDIDEANIRARPRRRARS